MTTELLTRLYYSPSSEAAYGGVDRLWRVAKKEAPNIQKTDVRKWLSTQHTYTLHKQTRHKFNRDRILVSRIDQVWEADLVDLISLSRHNNGYKYILVIIDVFSKQLHVRPLKSKTAEELVSALKVCFAKSTPEIFRSDQGKEFKNSRVKDLLADYGIRQQFALNPATKASVAERVNRSLKERMFRHFTKSGTWRYVEVLQKIVNGYNATVNRSTGQRPRDVTEKTSADVFRVMYGYANPREFLRDMAKRKRMRTLQVGDRVRVKLNMGPLDKRYLPNFSESIFTVENVMRGANRNTLFRISEGGVWLKRRFYEQELQRIKGQDHRLKVISRDTTRGRVRVKFSGDRHSQWIPETELRTI